MGKWPTKSERWAGFWAPSHVHEEEEGGALPDVVQVTLNLPSPPELTTTLVDPIPLVIDNASPGGQDDVTVDAAGIVTITEGVWAFDFTMSLYAESTPAGLYLQTQDGLQGWVASFVENGGVLNAARSGVLSAVGEVELQMGFLGDHTSVAAAVLQLIRLR